MAVGSTNWRLGLALSLTTAALWGILPIALKFLLNGMDAVTIVWWRFAVSAAGLAAFLAWRGGLPRLAGAGRPALVLLAIATLTLIGNYVLYLVALDHVTPSVTQVVIQLAPLMLLIGGVVVFHEHFARTQWIGFVILGTGLLLFFNERLPLLLQPTEGLGLGVSLTVAAGVCWAAYGLAQKKLLAHFSAQQVLWMIYVGAVALLLPASAPASIRGLDGLQLGMLGFCCANTLVAYGSFGEALYHWDLSRVSAVLATAPLFTIAGMWVVERFGLGLVAAEGLNGLSVAGALMVVVGSMTCALAARK
ncbi:MAG TPA: DMT family transporter [Steroidobacteraceae bacterium]|jgi:drug/metabolite transporter (DMT)-like permease|nr:DMT family transporter [Steroidobacteraceae bacterium]